MHPNQRVLKNLFVMWPVAAMLAICGCRDVVGPEEIELTSAESRWNSVRPTSNSYVMEQQVACFCAFGGTTFEVTVQSGAVVSARPLNSQGAEGPVQLASFRTVDQLFDEVRNALKHRDTLLAVSFHATMGYPSVVSLDPIKNARDDEVRYQTSKVTVGPS